MGLEIEEERNECVQESTCTALGVNSPPSFPVWCNSLLCQLLSTDEGKSMYQRLCKKVTTRGVRLQDCIVGGVVVPQHPVGILAGDSECYIVFSELFEPVLRALQPGYNFDIRGLFAIPCHSFIVLTWPQICHIYPPSTPLSSILTNTFFFFNFPYTCIHAITKVDNNTEKSDQNGHFMPQEKPIQPLQVPTIPTVLTLNELMDY